MKTKLDKNAEKFVSLMVEKIESISTNWEKPWFSNIASKQNFIPQNLSGRLYSGGNLFMLLMLCEEHNYQTPVFLTFNQAKNENISILKGAVSFPVYHTSFCAYHRETNEKISFADYQELTEEEKKDYRLVSYNNYFPVFNLDQTNFSDKFPERWESLKKKFGLINTPKTDNECMYENEVLNNMLKNQSWICRINQVSGDSAYYSLKNDSIVLPEKSQFKDGESFYCTALHEMGHSTGTHERLNRKGFYEKDIHNYGREELVAEMFAALGGLYLGVTSKIREENAQYLKSWMQSINEDPKFLFSVLADTVKAIKLMSEILNINLNFDVLEPTEDKELSKTA